MAQHVSQANRDAVLTELLLCRPTSRKELSRRTGLSPATISRTVEMLMAEELVSEGESFAAQGRGRREVSIDVVPDHSLVVGVDLGASATRLAVADLLARPVVARTVATPRTGSPEELAAWVADLVTTTAAARWDGVTAVAVGVPGSVHPSADRIDNAPNLPHVSGTTFAAQLRKRLAREVTFDNDVNLALLGEQYFGAARDSATAAMVNLGSGLGTALAVDHRILRGPTGIVGEFGALPFQGRRLEDFVTGNGITARAAELGIPLATPRALFEDGRPELDGLRTDFRLGLLTVLVAVTVSVEPSAIVVGGRIAGALRDQLATYHELLCEHISSPAELRTAALDEYSGAAGGVVAALHEVYAGLGVSPAALGQLPGENEPDFLTVLREIA